MDIKQFEAFWADRQPDRTDLAEFWSRRAQSFNTHSAEADSSAYRRDLVAKVAARATVGKADAVLDIGQAGMPWFLRGWLARSKVLISRPA